MENQIEYIGIANAWTSEDNTPEKFTNHQKNCSFGDMQMIKLGRCYHKIICNKCNISYEVDSSD